jgi:hypothetical protein
VVAMLQIMLANWGLRFALPCWWSAPTTQIRFISVKSAARLSSTTLPNQRECGHEVQVKAVRAGKPEISIERE